MKKLVIGLVLLVAGCSTVPKSSSPTFAGLAEEYLKGYLEWRPQTGTSLGMHAYDGKVTDFSSASIGAELARLESFDKRMAALDLSKISEREMFDYRILQSAIKREIFAFKDLQIYTRNPMTYASVIDVNIYIKRDFAALEDRVHSVIKILNEAPKIMAAARANLAETLPKPQIETAMEEASGAADFLGKDLVDALKTIKDDALMSEFNSANARAMDELRKYVTWLKEVKLPKADANYAIGRDKYVRLIEYGEMIHTSPEKLLEIGMAELKCKQQVFAEAAHKIDPTKQPFDVFKDIQKDHPTEKSLIPDTSKDLEMIRNFVREHHIISLPSSVRAQVAETPQFMRATSFASMDTPGPFETKATEAYYYVTPVEAEWPDKQKEEWLTAFNYYTTDIVSIHEAYPGHYVQFLHLNASTASQIKKIFNSYAFVEGWAHYSEQMMVDEGFGGPDSQKAAKYLLAQTDEALLRICRLCVSIKMHCQGMTVDEATKFFQDNCYYEEKPARQEAMRGTFDPEYLYYTVGKLEFLKLRQDFRKQEGQSFSLKSFHDEVLKHGAPPIRLLREVMLKDKRSWDEVF